tara:strand:+ start:809 stop:1216 length:408 start_codon:yes stop_codon:yes gene_type:complete
MDFASVIQNLNWLAVIASALSTFLIGGIWYSIFEKQWMLSNNFTRSDLEKQKISIVFGLSFLLSFIMALNLAMFIGQGDFVFGMIAGFMAGFGWLALAIGIIALFENRSLKYILINGGYMVLAFTVMGAILGAWK